LIQEPIQEVGDGIVPGGQVFGPPPQQAHM
jgi:hypothetical protein